MSEQSILDVRGLSTDYAVKRGGRTIQVHAVEDVSFTLARGEVLGIVGESGSGKTTLGRSIVRLARPHRGQVLFNGVDIFTAKAGTLRSLRLKIRMVFQDPFASLDPRRSIGDSVAEAGDIHGLFAKAVDRTRQIENALIEVGLDPSFATRYPHELSGGQRQRIGIARAILPTPEVVIADEPVSALDVSVQAQVLNLLADLRDKMRLAMIFISHDLGVVAQISDRVAVMYMGRTVETAATREILDRPIHPYTRALMAAMPTPDPNIRIKPASEVNESPSQFDRPIGCPYARRCSIASAGCVERKPELREVAPRRLAACHNV
jgi:peptide/nickel transport system ATP-binding protein/oligopeptide transport system ATP-binding protein